MKLYRCSFQDSSEIQSHSRLINPLALTIFPPCLAQCLPSLRGARGEPLRCNLLGACWDWAPQAVF